MNVLKQTNVTGTLFAPTPKDRIFAVVKRVMLAMVKTAQVKYISASHHNFTAMNNFFN